VERDGLPVFAILALLDFHQAQLWSLHGPLLSIATTFGLSLLSIYINVSLRQNVPSIPILNKLVSKSHKMPAKNVKNSLSLRKPPAFSL
jgi:hypothetical protein